MEWMKLNVKFSRILNPAILNAEWVGFQGDSEYVDENGVTQMGYWSFLDILQDEPTDDDWNLEDEVDDSVLYEDKWLFRIVNSKGNVCVVKFSYRRD